MKAVKNAEEGGQNLDDLQLTDRSFRLKFGWAVNKYRTYPHPWETGILGDNNDDFMFFAACIWETFNAIVKISAVAAAELMFAKTRVSFMKTGKFRRFNITVFFSLTSPNSFFFFPIFFHSYIFVYRCSLDCSTLSRHCLQHNDCYV